jgi:hypothetical protein
MRHDKNYKSAEDIEAAYRVAIQGGIAGAARVCAILSLLTLSSSIPVDSLVGWHTRPPLIMLESTCNCFEQLTERFFIITIFIVIIIWRMHTWIHFTDNAENRSGVSSPRSLALPHT